MGSVEPVAYLVAAAVGAAAVLVAGVVVHDVVGTVAASVGDALLVVPVDTVGSTLPDDCMDYTCSVLGMVE